MTYTKPIRVALYARVSTNNHGQDVTLQTRELKEFVERRGWQFAGEYVDLGISGSRVRRPELDRLMADAHRHQFNVVIVWKFDRFARSVSHLLRALETFQTLGIDFVSLSESLDTSTPAGKMVFTISASGKAPWRRGRMTMVRFRLSQSIQQMRVSNSWWANAPANGC